ncbi:MULTISPECIES: hypothetical protein [Glycomyces]|uniref:Membrane protein n=2 Tax=Glycomyces TaxID=58113 RepID=A0A9X3PRB3_9ACTN|nr:hypothetical protein [Glycomyces lechevalierae]MDA1387847.1 hypothetical protein [Glycomyces lechevalierae]MDR7336515.1 putative membrane protein [Glycomyces lechevalierae]
MMNRWGDQYMSGAGWWMMGLMVLFWAAVIVLLVWAVLRISRAIESRPAEGARAPESPRDVLDRRYAAGQIDSATYREMRAGLEGREPDGP